MPSLYDLTLQRVLLVVFMCKKPQVLLPFVSLVFFLASPYLILPGGQIVDVMMGKRLPILLGAPSACTETTEHDA